MQCGNFISPYAAPVDMLILSFPSMNRNDTELVAENQKKLHDIVEKGNRLGQGNREG